MRWPVLPVLAASAALAAPGSADPPGVLSLPVRRASAPAATRRARSALARDLPETNITDLTDAYFASVAVGNPPQPVDLIIDTGSSWLWVNPNCDYARPVQFCTSSPRYDPTQSTPAPVRDESLDGYRDYASGDWAEVQGYTDTVWLAAGFNIDAQPFGVANDSDGSFMGFLGLGPDLDTGFDSDVANDSVVSTAAAQGLIGTRTFALALETMPDLDSESPMSLIFGGVDKNQYKGQFFGLPVQTPGNGGGDSDWRFWVNATGVSYTLPDGTQRPETALAGENATYLLDTGTTGIYLPVDIVSAITADLQIDWSVGSFASIDCNAASQAGTITIIFGDNSIDVPLSALVFEQQPGACLFLVTSVSPSAANLHILGLSFLRNVYSVFDWDNQAVYLAERVDCGTEPDAEAISAGVDTVLSIEGNCS